MKEGKTTEKIIGGKGEREREGDKIGRTREIDWGKVFFCFEKRKRSANGGKKSQQNYVGTMLCEVVSCHVFACDVVNRHLIFCLVPGLWYYVVIRPNRTCRHLPCSVLSRHTSSCLGRACDFWRFDGASRRANLRHMWPTLRHGTPSHALQIHAFAAWTVESCYQRGKSWNWEWTVVLRFNYENEANRNA